MLRKPIFDKLVPGEHIFITRSPEDVQTGNVTYLGTLKGMDVRFGTESVYYWSVSDGCSYVEDFKNLIAVSSDEGDIELVEHFKERAQAVVKSALAKAHSDNKKWFEGLFP